MPRAGRWIRHVATSQTAGLCLAVALLAAVVVKAAPPTIADFGPRESFPWSDVRAAAVPQPSGRLTAGAGTSTARAGVRGEGPILVVTDPANPFTDDICTAILQTAGLPQCARADAGSLDASVTLTKYRSIILGDRVALSKGQIGRLTAWVRAGGQLIAMRPLDDLDDLLGIGQRVAVLPDGYFQVDRGRPEATGLVAESMQYHGDADLHHLDGATAFAGLSSTSLLDTGFPALTVRKVGSGTASMYAFDVARSVLLTRNGNPELTGRQTVSTDGRARLMDRFGDGYLDVSKAGIAQADKLMQLLTNQIVAATAAPRLWYLPSQPNATGGLLRAVVLLTGDDHASDSQTLPRFRLLRDSSPKGCSVAMWTCLTGTSYAYPGAFPDAAGKPYTDAGFEVSPHYSDNTQCADSWASQADLNALAAKDFAAWRQAYPSIAAAHPPTTERWHCYGIWKNYAGIPEADLSTGMVADTSQSCWPQAGFNVARCLFTGTALPMPYADQDGRLTGVLEFTTQVTDENPANRSVPGFRSLLSAAIADDGYPGYYTVQAHLDNLPWSNVEAQDVIDIAKDLRVPIISVRQATDFWTARARTRMKQFSYQGDSVTFRLSRPAPNLQILIPADHAGRQLKSVALDGTSVPFRTVTVEGANYGVITVTEPGRYRSVYG